MDWDSGPPSSRPFFARTARVPTLCDNDELSMCSVAPNISPRPPDPKTQPGEEANAIPAKRFCCRRCQWQALSMLPLLPLLARLSLSQRLGLAGLAALCTQRPARSHHGVLRLRVCICVVYPDRRAGPRKHGRSSGQLPRVHVPKVWQLKQLHDQYMTYCQTCRV